MEVEIKRQILDYYVHLWLHCHVTFNQNNIIETSSKLTSEEKTWLKDTFEKQRNIDLKRTKDIVTFETEKIKRNSNLKKTVTLAFLGASLLDNMYMQNTSVETNDMTLKDQYYFKMSKYKSIQLPDETILKKDFSEYMQNNKKAKKLLDEVVEYNKNVTNNLSSLNDSEKGTILREYSIPNKKLSEYQMQQIFNSAKTYLSSPNDILFVIDYDSQNNTNYRFNYYKSLLKQDISVPKQMKDVSQFLVIKNYYDNLGNMLNLTLVKYEIKPQSFKKLEDFVNKINDWEEKENYILKLKIEMVLQFFFEKYFNYPIGLADYLIRERERASELINFIKSELSEDDISSNPRLTFDKLLYWFQREYLKTLSSPVSFQLTAFVASSIQSLLFPDKKEFMVKYISEFVSTFVNYDFEEKKQSWYYYAKLFLKYIPDPLILYTLLYILVYKPMSQTPEKITEEYIKMNLSPIFFFNNMISNLDCFHIDVDTIMPNNKENLTQYLNFCIILCKIIKEGKELNNTKFTKYIVPNDLSFFLSMYVNDKQKFNFVVKYFVKNMVKLKQSTITQTTLNNDDIVQFFTITSSLFEKILLIIENTYDNKPMKIIPIKFIGNELTLTSENKNNIEINIQSLNLFFLNTSRDDVEQNDIDFIKNLHLYTLYMYTATRKKK